MLFLDSLGNSEVHLERCIAGFLTSGIIPAVRHALDNLMITNPVVIPASATIFGQAVQWRTSDVCGLDMSAVNQHR